MKKSSLLLGRRVEYQGGRMTEAQLNGALSAVRTVLLLLGAFLVQNGFGQTGIYRDIESAA